MGLILKNGGAAPIHDLPRVGVAAFRRHVIEGCSSGGRIGALFGVPQSSGPLLVVAAVVHGARGEIDLVCAEPGDRYPSITAECPAAHWLERELHEQWGVLPEGHPWLKPIRFTAEGSRPGVTEHFAMRGDEVHEVAVGPVHAGVIEPGHFRFQCAGEHVFHLEISLGYQHRGAEEGFVGGPTKRTVHQIETVAGDTSVAHATAYAHVVEALADVEAPPRAQVIRGIALELERLANHAGDLGALASDVAFLPTASFCGRLRGDYLNATARICGSRFGRGLVRPGGVRFDLEPDRAEAVRAAIEAALEDTRGAVDLLWKTASVVARFEDTGRVSHETALALGLRGMAARASGIARDVRKELPLGVWRTAKIEPAVVDTGDVLARAQVRWQEMERSGAFLLEQLRALPDADLRVPWAPAAIRPEHLAVALVEGWRGEVCHVALTDENGRFQRYKAIDPSFHNWIGLAMALRDQPISDFPLCNKSFNLSYCGHDL